MSSLGEKLSFILKKDNDGNSYIVDAFLTKSLRLKCPQCGKVNWSFNYLYDEDRYGWISRRYVYCCRDCLIHYTNWGSTYDWEDKNHQIEKVCKVNGDHRKETKSVTQIEKDFWSSLGQKSKEQRGNSR